MAGLKKTPPCLHGGVFLISPYSFLRLVVRYPSGFPPSRGRLRCNSANTAAVVDPDAVTDCHIVAILEDLELATDRIPCVGALVVAEVRTRTHVIAVGHQRFAIVALRLSPVLGDDANEVPTRFRRDRHEVRWDHVRVRPVDLTDKPALSGSQSLGRAPSSRSGRRLGSMSQSRCALTIHLPSSSRCSMASAGRLRPIRRPCRSHPR